MTAQKLLGDSHSGPFEYGWNPVTVRYNFKWHAYVESDIGFAQLSTDANGATLTTDLINFGFKLGYRFLSERRVNPLAYFGFGFFNFSTGNSDHYWDGYGSFGGGVEAFLSRYLGLNLTTDLRYTTGDDFDATRILPGKDGFFNVGLGLNYYFGGRGSHLPYESAYSETDDEYDWQADVVTVEEPPVVEDIEEAPPAPVLAEASADTAEKQGLQKTLAEKDQELRLMTAKMKAFEKHEAQIQQKLKQSGYRKSLHNRGVTERERQLRDRLQAALDYFALEKYEDAILSFKSILYEDPDGPFSTTAWYWLGECHYQRQEYHAAIEAFEIAELHTPVESPKHEMAQIMIALTRWKLGDTAQAKQRLESILANISNFGFGPVVHEYLIEMASGQVESTN